MSTDTEINEASSDEPRVLCSIAADTVLRVLTFAAKDDVRFYLNGVSVRPGNGSAIVSASDGHIAYSEEDAYGTADSALVFQISTRVKPAFRRGNRVVIEGTSKTATLQIIDENDTIVYIEPGNAIVPGKFPDLTAVLGDPTQWLEGIGGAFKVALLKRALSHEGAIRFYRPPGEIDGRRCAYWVYQSPYGNKGVGVVMPYSSIEGIESSIPSIYLAA